VVAEEVFEVDIPLPTEASRSSVSEVFPRPGSIND
jgi:hypothetical protein